ncbi:MAG: chitobiase/beta-hexosaminidase C-terminal domain-containing protein [Verrucomicrobia bacterium]|nr:chitobiase/beta-hexosaminidase C-terminal domain-containing protein [Verrucomicrobiota bacterium]
MKFSIRFWPRIPSGFFCPQTRSRTGVLSLCAVLFAAFPAWAGPPDVVINEVMSSNGSVIHDEDGDYGDWIEILNRGNDSVNLEGWGISDRLDQPFRWVFPSFTLGPGERVLVWATGKDRKEDQEVNPIPPDEMEGLVAWFKADALTGLDHGEAVTLWPDQSGLENHATQDAELAMPLYLENVINDLPALSFNGSSHQFSLPRETFSGMDSLENFTFFALANWEGKTISGIWGTGPSNATSGNLHFEINSGGSLRLRVAGMDSIQASNAVQPGWHLFGASQLSNDDDPVSRVFVDGQIVGTRFEDTGNSALAEYGGFFLGNSHNSQRNFEGAIAEVILFNRALETGERLGIEDYLNIKYGRSSPDSATPPLHTNFSISSEGEPLVLTRPDGGIADQIPPQWIPRDRSYGRFPDGGEDFAWFMDPSPGAENTAPAYSAPLPPPTFSHARGFYGQSFHLSLSHADEEAELYFTTDGSEPTESGGTLYTEPIPINATSTIRAAALKPGALPVPEIMTHSYFFLDDVLAQRDDPASLGMPENWGSWSATHYGFTEEVVHDPAYAPLMYDVMTAVPTLSLVIDMEDMFDDDTGIYANRTRKGVAWERPVSVELIYPDNTRGRNFHINAGLRAQGGASRQVARTPKGSLRLLFKGIYGSTRMNEPFFKNAGSALEEFNTITLRSEYNNEWLHPNGIGGGNQRARGQYVRDPFIRFSQVAMSGSGSRSKHVHLYINGVYWGLYNPSMRIDAAFAASHFGGEREDWDARTQNGLRDGNANAWNAMQQFIDNADFSNAQDYETFVQEHIDLPQYIDYMIVNLWSGMHDWPHNNWNAVRRREPGAGWKFFCWDSERSMEGLHDNRVDVYHHAARPYDAMRANPEFRLKFADHVHRHMFNGGELTPERAIARYAALAKTVELAVIAESARWGNYRRDKHQVDGPHELYTRDDQWLLEYHRLVNNYLPQRTGVVLQQFRNAGLYPQVDAPSFHQHGGALALGEDLEITAPEGEIRYTLDESDPRDPDAVTYTEPISLEAPATVKARVWHNGEWSALLEAYFEPAEYVPLPLHGWDFEDPETFLSPSVSLLPGTLKVVPGPEEDVFRNDPAQDFETAHLRINHPIGKEMILSLPTTGYDNIRFEFLTRRSGQGAGLQNLSYSLNGGTDWVEWALYPIYNDSPQPRSFDFSGIAGSSDNPDFAVRITFAQGEGGTAGNNRFDDVMLWGTPMDPASAPLMVDDETVPEMRTLLAGQPVSMDVSTWFLNAGGTPLDYLVEVSDAGVLQVSLNGDELTFTPLKAGESLLTVTASRDGQPPVAAQTRVLVHPTPHSLQSSNYHFNHWDAETPAGVYPDHMLFLQSEVGDPGFFTPLNRAYAIPSEDAADPVDTAFPYAATSRTRINGLGESGLALINTGRGRDLGAAVLSLDTTNVSDIRVTWLAGTLLPNQREYALRLQYRTSPDADWSNVLHKGLPVEYVRNPSEGHTRLMGPVRLPQALENLPFVQLQWRYYHVSGDSGPRAQLRLDEIAVTTAENPLVSDGFVFDGLSKALSSEGIPPFSVRVVDAEGIWVSDFQGEITLSLQGSGTLDGTLIADAVDGIAWFDDLTWDGIGAFTLLAEASGVPSSTSPELRRVRMIPLMTPRFQQGEQDELGDNLNREPFAWRIRLQGLAPGSAYGYGNRMIYDDMDSDPASNGAGNFILIPEEAGAPYVRSTSFPRFEEGDLNSRHARLTADAQGEWEGWLITEPSGNPRFAPGNVLRPLLMLNDPTLEATWYLRGSDTLEVLELGDMPHQASALYGRTESSAKFVALHDNVQGEGRPLAITHVEAGGSEFDDRYAAFYEEVVAGNPGVWGALIPNELAEGVKRISFLDVHGNEVDALVYEDGAPQTVMASGGSAAVWLPETSEYHFLPPGDGRWDATHHWSTGAVPNAVGLRVYMGAPVSGNREIVLPEGLDVTVGEMIFTNGAYRNRISGLGTLTFQTEASETSALIRVTDAGEGFAEFDLDGSVTLMSNLLLDTQVVEIGPDMPEFGAVRLRGEWVGPGSLAKTGPGVASVTGAGKGFTGELRIQEGVLRITENATPGQIEAVVVEPGGQLRLVSEGEGRTYAFGGSLHLAGMGRNPDDVPEGDQRGILGALRLDPSGNGNEGLVPANIVLQGETVSLHVDGTGNTLDLQGTVSGNATLSKSGGGSLILSGTGADPMPISLANGELRVNGDFANSAVSIDENGVLSGSGHLGTLSGLGQVVLHAGDLLSVESVNGLNYRFQPGALLRLRADPPFVAGFNAANQITLIHPDLAYEGQSHRAAFFSDVAANSVPSVQNADWTFLALDEKGQETPVSVIPEIRAVAHTLQVDAGPVHGGILRFDFGPDAPGGYMEWANTHFTAAELEDENISGPPAQPQGDHVANALKYILGVPPNTEVTPDHLPAIVMTPEKGLVFRYTRHRLFPGPFPLSESADFLGDPESWQPAAPGYSHEHPPWIIEHIEIPPQVPMRFFRLSY